MCTHELKESFRPADCCDHTDVSKHLVLKCPFIDNIEHSLDASVRRMLASDYSVMYTWSLSCLPTWRLPTGWFLLILGPTRQNYHKFANWFMQRCRHVFQLLLLQQSLCVSYISAVYKPGHDKDMSAIASTR